MIGSLPGKPFEPSRTAAMVIVSEIVPSLALIERVLNVIVAGLIVTVFPDRLTPAGAVDEKVPPFTEYCHVDIVVFTAVPTTVKFVAGVGVPAALYLITCVAAFK